MPYSSPTTEKVLDSAVYVDYSAYLMVMMRVSDEAHAAILEHAGKLERAASRRVSLTDALDALIRVGTAPERENATEQAAS